MTAKRSFEIIRKVKARRNTRALWTKAQESLYKECVACLEHAGFTVRREELKRGHCWKVVSGSCRSHTHRYVFVDSRLTPNEQIAFLSAKVQELGLALKPVEQPALGFDSAA